MVKSYYELNSDIAKKTWGFSPNREIKPGHYANGFFREICGGSSDIETLIKAASAYNRGTSKFSNEFILELINNSYLVEEEDDEKEIFKKVGDLRKALDFILDQDKGLFRTANKSMSSPTISHYSMISSDRSDNSTGKFIAQLLAYHNQELVNELRMVLSDHNDNIYKLCLPLLKINDMGEAPNLEEQYKNIITNSLFLKKVNIAFENLFLYKDKLDKNVFLQRLVNLGYFILYLHLINSNSRKNELIPLFLVTVNPSKELKELSRASFIRARQSIQKGFEIRFEEYCNEQWGKGLSIENCQNIFEQLLNNMEQKDQKMVEVIQQNFNADFLSNVIINKDNEFDTLFYNAYTRTAFNYFNLDTPEDVARFIGRNVGLLYPREGGGGEKYYNPNARFLDMLVVTLIKPDEEITIEEFWDRARDTFGIIVGSNRLLDNKLLDAFSLRTASVNQTISNLKNFTEQLSRMGYVTEYADDIAMIKGDG